MDRDYLTSVLASTAAVLILLAGSIPSLSCCWAGVGFIGSALLVQVFAESPQ